MGVDYYPCDWCEEIYCCGGGYYSVDIDKNDKNEICGLCQNCGEAAKKSGMIYKDENYWQATQSFIDKWISYIECRKQDMETCIKKLKKIVITKVEEIDKMDENED